MSPPSPPKNIPLGQSDFLRMRLDGGYYVDKSSFLDWLKDGGGEVTPLQQAILSGDASKVEERLKELLLRHVSSQDVTKTQGEAFYHAFVLGMLVTLERSHRVRSNRETGGGRADLLLIPRQAGQAGVVLEFKRQTGRPKTLRALAQAAPEPIEQRGYRRELEDAGAAPIYSLGIAFSGKEEEVCGGRPVVPPEEDDVCGGRIGSVQRTIWSS